MAAAAGEGGHARCEDEVEGGGGAERWGRGVP
jgi:hypothetical protein